MFEIEIKQMISFHIPLYNYISSNPIMFLYLLLYELHWSPVNIALFFYSELLACDILLHLTPFL